MVKKCILILLLILAVFSVWSVGLYFVYPDVSTLRKTNPKKSAFMEYRENEWRQLGRKKTLVQRWVPLSQVSPFVIKAVIIAEDDKFWAHEGFDFEGDRYRFLANC